MLTRLSFRSSRNLLWTCKRRFPGLRLNSNTKRELDHHESIIQDDPLDIVSFLMAENTKIDLLEKDGIDAKKSNSLKEKEQIDILGEEEEEASYKDQFDLAFDNLEDPFSNKQQDKYHMDGNVRASKMDAINEKAEELDEVDMLFKALNIKIDKDESKYVTENEARSPRNSFDEQIAPMNGADDAFGGSLRDKPRFMSNLTKEVEQILRTPKKDTTRSGKDTSLEKLFLTTTEKINPTINYIMHDEKLNSVGKVEKYFKGIVQEWRELDKRSIDDVAVHKQMYFHRYLKKSEENEHLERSFQEIEKSSLDNPARPNLNVFTMPIIFNTILRKLYMEFYNGQSAFYLFNMLKQDIRLYTICCNQETYNEILKIIWIYYGKSGLYNIELVYVEMLNHGFTGDIKTCSTLRQIIIDYHKIKLGQFTWFGNAPLWTKEDDLRVRKLEDNLATLTRQLNSRTL